MVQQAQETKDANLPYPSSRLHEFLGKMLLIRRFEEKTKEMLFMNRVRGYCHLNIGEEATVVGTVLALHANDQFIASYRDHGYAIACGTHPRAVMAELYGKATGCAGGRGGSMHMVDVNHGFYGGYGIVGGQLPLAAGLALAADYLNEDRAVLCVTGEGSTNIGAFHESLNLSSVWNLPVVWVVSNNQYGMGTSVNEASGEPHIYKRACAYGMHGEAVDGMDVLAVSEAATRLLDRARISRQPSLLEAITYRFEGHSYADAGKVYRPAEEIERWKQKDPIRTLQRYMEEHQLLDQKQYDELEKSVEFAVQDAVDFAEASPLPSLDTLYDHLYTQEGMAS